MDYVKSSPDGFGGTGPRRALAALLTLPLLASCALRDLGRDIEVIDQLARLEGTTVSLDGPGGPTLVAVYDLAGLEPVMVNYAVQLEPGPFELLVTPGRYMVAAFEDLDRDFAYAPGEPVGHVGRDHPIEVGAGETAAGLVVSLSSAAEPAGGVALDLSGRRANERLAAPRRNVGVVASLDDPRFSARGGRAASDRPLEAIATGAVGVFFLEPYDPARIPVLYVHGMNGSPQDLRPLIEDLDRDRFQAWFVAYPSTLRLEGIAGFVHEAVLDLGVTYDLRRLYVVAHSMGGLVARSFVNKNVALKKRELVGVLITLATPFGGQQGAAVIDQVPGALVPKWVRGVSWVDMIPKSRFFHDLYYSPLAPYVRHHLFFAWLPDSQQTSGGDGVIPLWSQLDNRASATAQIHPAEASHVGILESALVHRRVREILAAAWERDRAMLRPDLYVERSAAYLSDASDFRFDWRGEDQSEERAAAFQQRVAERAPALRALLSSRVVLDALARANADPEAAERSTLFARDRRWTGGEAAEVAARATDADCNRALAEYTESDPVVAEIIVTTRFGANVCQSRLTSDYYQADESWWSRTAQEGRVWRGQLEYDESVDAFGVSLHVPLPGSEPGAPVAGVVKILVREPPQE